MPPGLGGQHAGDRVGAVAGGAPTRHGRCAAPPGAASWPRAAALRRRSSSGITTAASRSPRGRPSSSSAASDAGDHVVGHDPDRAGLAVGPADRAGLGDVEQAEQREGGQQPRPGRARQRQQRDPLAGELVDHHPAGIALDPRRGDRHGRRPRPRAAAASHSAPGARPAAAAPAPTASSEPAVPGAPRRVAAARAARDQPAGRPSRGRVRPLCRAGVSGFSPSLAR